MTALHNLELQGKYLHRKVFTFVCNYKATPCLPDKLGKNSCHVSGKYDITTPPLQVILQ